MQPDLSRRQYLRALALAAAGLVLPWAAGAVEPFKRIGPPRLRLSLAAYSFDRFLKDNSGKNPAGATGKRFDLFAFVDYCAAQGCAGAELTSYYFPKEVDRDYLIKLRRHCFLSGVDISGTAVGNTFTLPPGDKRTEQIALVKKWVDHAAVLGAPHIRVFAGDASGTSLAEAQKRSIEALEECGDYAGKQGIFLGIENHGGIVAEAASILQIVRAVKNPWVGINLDSGNFQTEDPYHDFAACVPYTVNVQLKVEIQRRGQKKELADLKRFMDLLREGGYQGYVALEYEAEEDPWKAVPGLLQKMQQLLAGGPNPDPAQSDYGRRV